MNTTFKPKTRVRRIRVPNPRPRCIECRQFIKGTFGGVGREAIVVNVYVRGVWDRVEAYHPECHKRLGEPYGTPTVPEKRTGHRVMGQ